MLPGPWYVAYAAPEPRSKDHAVRKLWHLYQFHLAVAPAMQHIKISRAIAEDEKIAVAKLTLLDGFLDGHRLHGDRLTARENVGLDDGGTGRERMNRDGGLYPCAGQLSIF